MADSVRNLNCALLFCAIILVNLYCVKMYPTQAKTCGVELAKRISDVCQNLGGYNIFNKREISNESRRLLPRHRVRRRVVDECCKKACSDYAISQYCIASEPYME